MFADRTSSATLRANQLRLYFASFAYVLMHGLRRLGLAGTAYAKAQCTTIRLKLLNIGARLRITVRKVWLRKQRARISPKSRLGEKLAYIANHWDGLQAFLADGRVEMDNNIVENAIRPLALNRKNALFAGHDEGARAWARIASLVETAKMNGVNPHTYLKATLEAIAAGHPASDIDALMPWAYTQTSS